MNSAVFSNESKQVAVALTHFKHGTPTGKWASDQMEYALSQTPVDYSTWVDFKTAFKSHFIPPQTQLEAMQNMHSYAMGSKDFNQWYQTWSTYAHWANVNKETKMFAFHKLIPAPLHSKILGVSPPPSTLSNLVEKAREFDRNWHMFSGPKPHSGTRNPQVQEIQAEDKLPMEINTVGKKLTK